jgi:hypothetical protein
MDGVGWMMVLAALEGLGRAQAAAALEEGAAVVVLVVVVVVVVTAQEEAAPGGTTTPTTLLVGVGVAVGSRLAVAAAAGPLVVAVQTGQTLGMGLTGCRQVGLTLLSCCRW